MTTTEDDDRPRDIDAERSVLGACMTSSAVIPDVQDILTPQDFYRPAHATIFELIGELFESGHPTDPVSLAAVLDKRGHLLGVGGAPELHTIYADTATAINAGYWAEIVADRAARARLLDASLHLRQLARSPETTAEVQERAREVVEEATVARVSDAEDGAWMPDVVDDHIASWDEERESTIELPYADLEDVMGGLRSGQVIVVAGRPGMGKSVFGTDCARHAAANGHSTLIVSLEMSRQDVLNRIVAAEAKVRMADIEARTVSLDDRYRVNRVREHLNGLPIRIEDRFSTGLARLRAVARECKRGERGLDLIVVDYLQLLTPADPKLPRREQVDAFSRGLKSLAKELDLPVIAIAQLNRGPEQRTDKKPLVSDLRESGSLEQDADAVILIHRPDAFERADPRAGEADLILAKHRNGPTATITVAHQLHYARFCDIARG